MALREKVLNLKTGWATFGSNQQTFSPALSLSHLCGDISSRSSLQNGVNSATMEAFMAAAAQHFWCQMWRLSWPYNIATYLAALHYVDYLLAVSKVAWALPQAPLEKWTAQTVTQRWPHRHFSSFCCLFSNTRYCHNQSWRLLLHYCCCCHHYGHCYGLERFSVLNSLIWQDESNYGTSRDTLMS